MENIFENIFSLPTTTTNNTTTTPTNTTDDSWLLGTSSSILHPYQNFDSFSLQQQLLQQQQQPTTPYFYIPTPNNLNNNYNNNYNNDLNNNNNNNFNNFNNFTQTTETTESLENPQVKEQLLLIQQQKQHTNEQIQQTLQNYHQQQQQTYENRQHQFDQQHQQPIQQITSSPLSDASPTIVVNSNNNNNNNNSNNSNNNNNSNNSNNNNNNNNNIIFDQPQFFNLAPIPQTSSPHVDFINNPITNTNTANTTAIVPPVINIANTTKTTLSHTKRKTANKNEENKQKKIEKDQQQSCNQFESDESFEDDTSSITTTTTTTTIIDEDEKKKSINRVYHKKHREKKKDYIKLMESQMASLSFQNQKLRKENESLKKNGEGVDSLRPDRFYFKFYNDVVDITKKLKLALEVKDERSLIYLLHIYHKVFADLYNLCKRDVDLVLHPNMQLLLASISYIPHCDPIVFDIISGPGSDIWINQFKEEACLSPYQSTKFEELRIKFTELDQKFLRDRLELDSEVKKFFNTNMLLLPKHYNPFNIIDDMSNQQPYISDISQSPLIKSQPLDLCQMLEFVCKLDALKSKVYLGRILILDIYAMVSSLLTPTQEAMFHVRINEQISFDFSNLGLINHVWTSLMPSKSVLDISESLEKIANGTTNISPTPFSLKPATFNIFK